MKSCIVNHVKSFLIAWFLIYCIPTLLGVCLGEVDIFESLLSGWIAILILVGILLPVILLANLIFPLLEKEDKSGRDN